MSKIYLLCEQIGIMYKMYGAVSDEKTAEKWCNIKSKDLSTQSIYNFKQTLELNDLELLNRIAKTKENDRK